MSSGAATTTHVGGKRRPLLRGWSHALAAIGAVGFTVALVVRCQDDVLRLVTMLVYGFSTIGLFGFSAVYHIVTWKPVARRLLGVLDYGNIFIMIAATATAIGANVLVGWERVALLAAVWVLALAGVAANVFQVGWSRPLRVGLYLLTGLSGLIALPGLLAALPPAAIGVGVLGGIFYAVGGAIYALRQPDPYPRVFGYHEIFHLFVIAGGVAFATVIWFWVVPFAGQ